MNSEAVQPEKKQGIRVLGEPYEKLPDDLYIPPDALEVFMEAFEGPLDLLLYLIRKQNLDILNIPVNLIARQYIEYIELMQEMRFELAAEYLLMAAMLAEIKSRMLLPRPVDDEEEGEDPRAELVRRLQEYEQFKTAAENLDDLPRVNRDIFVAGATPEKIVFSKKLPQPQIKDLLYAFREVMLRSELFSSHKIEREPLTVRERMTRILNLLSGGRRAGFHELIDIEEGRMGVVVCFIAVLELARDSVLDIDQSKPFTPLVISMAGARQSEMNSHNE